MKRRTWRDGVIGGVLGGVLLASACGGEGAAGADVTVDALADGQDVQEVGDAQGEPDAPGEDAAPERPVYARDGELRLNHLRAVGTHNSYHLYEGETIPEWSYRFDPLTVQLAEQGVRQLELDVHWHPEKAELEVYHVALVDEGTTCRRFVDCLAELKVWSDANPGHHPLFVFIEAKDDQAGLFPDREAPLLDHHADIDAAIRSVWPPERLLEPGEVQGDAASLREAVTGAGWPTLGEVRDHLVVVFLERGEHRDLYTSGGTSLAGRAMFVTADPGPPESWPTWAAIVAADDPTSPWIAPMAEAGLIVRTRADADVAPPDPEDAPRLAAALASGAHLLSTDYPAPADNGYVVAIPGGQPSGCHPLTAPAGCTSADVEALPP